MLQPLLLGAQYAGKQRVNNMSNKAQAQGMAAQDGWLQHFPVPFFAVVMGAVWAHPGDARGRKRAWPAAWV